MRRPYGGPVDDEGLAAARAAAVLLRPDVDVIVMCRGLLGDMLNGGANLRPEDAAVPAIPRPRRSRETIPRPDAPPVVPAKPPRADLLTYPKSSWRTILVRRTHDVALSLQLATERWAELGMTGDLVHHRVTWWRTIPLRRGPVTDLVGAVDEQRRHVTECEPHRAGASPGIEWRTEVRP